MIFIQDEDAHVLDISYTLGVYIFRTRIRRALARSVAVMFGDALPTSDPRVSSVLPPTVCTRMTRATPDAQHAHTRTHIDEENSERQNAMPYVSEPNPTLTVDPSDRCALDGWA
jgi:hypothetical protein